MSPQNFRFDPGQVLCSHLNRSRMGRIGWIEAQLFGIGDRELLGQPDRPFAIEPYAGLFARPKAEGAAVASV